MPLDRLKIQGFRCLHQVELELDPRVNLITGPNASGKTSLLESVFFLSRARSFRTPYLEQLIQDGESESVVSGRIRGVSRETSIGVRCTRSETEARLGGEPVQSLADLAQALPVQAIDPEIHKLLEEGPARRRRFLDWGVFHVEPEFLGHWRRYQRALRQRNAALRRDLPRKDLNVWEKTLVESGVEVHAARRRHVDALLPLATRHAEFLLGEPLDLVLKAGWDEALAFSEALDRSWERDRQRQATQTGPHRADFVLTLSGKRARNRVSRGQQKLIACATMLAQMNLLAAHSEAPRIVLLDDPAAELDSEHLERLLQIVCQDGSQLLITSLKSDLPGLSGPSKHIQISQGEIIKVI